MPPYVPPHLRPGFVAPKPVAVDYTGRVHWPTNVDPHLETNVVEPTRETLGLGTKKPILKLVTSIKSNVAPLARPTTRVSKFPKKFRAAVLHHMKTEPVKKPHHVLQSKRRYTVRAPKNKKITRRFRG